MAIQCGIVGLPNVGKSTLFNALTKAGIAAANFPFCTIEPNVGVVPVPDPRLNALAGIVNAWLLWRYLRRDGLLVPQPGWGAFLLKMLVACVVMTAVVLAARHFVGDWCALGSVWHRVAWLFAAILAGALAYGGTQVAMGLRPRHLRH